MRKKNYFSQYKKKMVLLVQRSVLLAALFMLFVVSLSAGAELLDRVVAQVDDQAITYSEFSLKFNGMKRVLPSITEDEALNSMINSLLLLQRAKKMKLEAAAEDDLIKEYVDITIRSRITIPEDRLIEYYNKNKQEFGDKDFSSVRDEIEKYLLELEINDRLKDHLKELQSQANIVIQLRYK
jgi:parvulin-like peptidyl-prolyl isomerase